MDDEDAKDNDMTMGQQLNMQATPALECCSLSLLNTQTPVDRNDVDVDVVLGYRSSSSNRTSAVIYFPTRQQLLRLRLLLWIFFTNILIFPLQQTNKKKRAFPWF